MQCILHNIYIINLYLKIELLYDITFLLIIEDFIYDRNLIIHEVILLTMNDLNLSNTSTTVKNNQKIISIFFIGF